MRATSGGKKLKIIIKIKHNEYYNKLMNSLDMGAWGGGCTVAGI
jgi:hypothetical protein